jgi:hypothetical protein
MQTLDHVLGADPENPSRLHHTVLLTPIEVG